MFDLPIVPKPHQTYEGVYVPLDYGLGFWWDIDLFLESRATWAPPTESKPLPKKKFSLPGPKGYNG